MWRYNIKLYLAFVVRNLYNQKFKQIINIDWGFCQKYTFSIFKEPISKKKRICSLGTISHFHIKIMSARTPYLVPPIINLSKDKNNIFIYYGGRSCVKPLINWDQ